jgi:hypothetical protein
MGYEVFLRSKTQKLAQSDSLENIERSRQNNQMTLVHKLKYLISLSLILGSSIGLIAQTKPEEEKKEETSRTTVTEEIEVVRSYKPILADAVKIRRSPDLNSSKSFNPKVKYDLMDKRLELNSAIRELEAQKLIQPKESELDNNYAKLGLGNLGTSLAELHLGTGRDEALQVGFNLNHWSMNGKLEKQKMSEQNLGLYGRSIGDQFIIDGKLSYNRKTNHFYGIDEDELSFLNPDPKKQRFNFIEGEAGIYNRVNAFDMDKLSFGAKVNGYLFNNIFEGKENAFILSGGISKNLNKFQLGVNSALDFTTTKDRAYGSLNNHIFKLNPFIKIDGEQFKLTAGLNYISEFGTNKENHLFPAASLDFSIVPNYLAVFGIFGGDVEKTRLKDLSNINPYLNENIAIKNQVDKFNIEGGVKGTLAANIGYKASVSHRTIDNLYFFVNDTVGNQRERFNVEYASGNSKILALTGEINVQFSEAFRVDGKLELKEYSLKDELNAWHYPAMRLSSNASFKIAQKFRLTADVFLQGDSKAKIYDVATLEPSDYTIKTLKAFADLGVGASYQHDKKIGAFLKINNILGNEYQRFLYYPNYGFNILGGFTYGF